MSGWNAHHGQLELDLAGVLVGDPGLKGLVEGLVDGLVGPLPVLDGGVVVALEAAGVAQGRQRGLPHARHCTGRRQSAVCKERGAVTHALSWPLSPPEEAVIRIL